MSTVSFKRSPNVNNIPIVDGQLIFDETHNKIYMDNGNERLQYGGDVSLIEDVSYATSNNAFSANGSLGVFTQKLSVIDNKDTALAVVEQHVPVGCLAFQSTIGNADYSGIGNTVSDSLVTLKNNITSINGQLTANNNAMYMDYHDGKYGVNTSSTRGADTFIPFKSAPEFVYLGSYPTTSSFDLTSYDHYQDFTNDSFIFKNVRGTARSQSRGEYTSVSCGISAISISYNNETGILTLSGGSGHNKVLGPDQTMAEEIWANTIVDVYVII